MTLSDKKLLLIEKSELHLCNETYPNLLCFSWSPFHNFPLPHSSFDGISYDGM